VNKLEVNEIEQRFAERVKQIRTVLNWSAQEVANRSGISRVAIARIEVGDRGVSLGDAVALSDALGVPLADMIRPGEFSVTATIAYEVGG
jgi:transcriptional regulator with XRE-family HTH domain